MVGAQSFIWRDKVTKLAQNRQLQAYVQERLEGAISDVHGKSKHLLPSMRHYLQTNLKESGDASFVNCGQYHRSCFDRLGVVIRVCPDGLVWVRFRATGRIDATNAADFRALGPPDER